MCWQWHCWTVSIGDVGIRHSDCLSRKCLNVLKIVNAKVVCNYLMPVIFLRFRHGLACAQALQHD